jgi:glycosyltransferase involved in cell wall biosynthesis
VLSTNPPGREAAGERICLVVADRRGLTDWAAEAIEKLISRRAAVHVLYCGADPSPMLSHPVALHRLNDIPVPDRVLVASVEPQAPADDSEKVRAALESLLKQHPFDAIHFGVRGGLGFRCIQAKQAALAFSQVSLIAHLDTCSHHLRALNHSWPSSIDDLILDYIEQHLYENADAAEIHSRDAAAFINTLHWKVNSSASVIGGAVSSANPSVTVGIAHYNLGQYLSAALSSLAVQSYKNLEVIVVDDGSTEASSVAAFAAMEKRYPGFRFLRQPNGGIGAARNRCLAEARGEYFIPMDADNIARSDMVERFVAAIERNPSLSAMTCYFLAFPECDSHLPKHISYANRPIGGPHALSCIRNIYGDANGILRTTDFREMGGYETDRGTSCEDWEAYVKLIHAGKRIGVVPDYLFYYRHRDAGFSRSTNWFANHQRVLRQFTRSARLRSGVDATVWTALLGFQRQLLQLTERQKCRRYRVADAIYNLLATLSPRRWLKRLLTTQRS